MSYKMETDKLRQIRDFVDDIELTIPEDELCARYEKLYTGAVNDVMREMCIVNCALPPEIHPLEKEMVCCGIAFTIRSCKDPTLTGELEHRVKMLEEIKSNHICVWNANGDDEASHWGEVMTQASMKRGAKGAIVDGGIRDTRGILNLKFPIWYKYRTSNGALSRTKMTGYQVPIQVGNCIIKPGDIIFADIDGAMVIPRKIAVEVLLRAEAIEKNEEEIKEWVSAGMSAEEIHSRGGYF
ncbi:MAG: dimethylmenaquinone methyltransferase [Phycisphaeraceae bacterium]|nr:dimethylmenaquinone methyltransferase [Phycisphaeraceae bacterium]